MKPADRLELSAHFALLPGDGIGREVMDAAREVLDVVASRFGLKLSYDSIPCGGEYYLEHGRDWPEDGEQRCRSADVILLGAVGFPSPTGSGPVMRADGHMAGYSAVLGNRTTLDLFANVRPVRLLDGIQHLISGHRRALWRPEDVDFVIIRENTEGLYVGAGAVLRPGGVGQLAVDTRIVTRAASERVCRLAFQLAVSRAHQKRREGRVTAVVKHNVLDGCRLFVEVFEDTAKAFPEVKKNVTLVDAFAPALIQKPEELDVVVTTNMFGDILTDLAAVLQGGMGMAVGCNLGDSSAMFEPIHGSAPDIAGLGIANPLAMVLSAAEALKWLGTNTYRPSEWMRAGQCVEDSVRALVSSGGPLTPDLAGEAQGATTAEVTAALKDRVFSTSSRRR